MRLSFDKARSRWVVLGPERLFVPDEIAAEILRRCDGTTSVAAIVDALAADYDAAHGEIAGDVVALIGELRERGVLVS
ncbi:MAG: pyrroloquinoline quinone biosynthesis peptide chaperone PqqD [Rhodospirillales bacterium]|nr:pyrroloquinoline quinone biosynthesis peptide chaperone PqqD [Rhodospirillales bacterium]